MKNRGALPRAVILQSVLAIACGAPVAAYDFGEQVSVTGVASLAGQCQKLAGEVVADGLCRGALAFQPALRVRPGEAHEIFVKLGFAAGNGLNDVTPFSLTPWAADLQGSVENINGGKRDFLLTAWYRYAVELGGENAFHITAGIIDSTDYLDTNAYSNDEYTQFMNAALVNGPNVFVPSYAPGLAAQWLKKRLSLTGVYMDVGRPGSDSVDFYGIELSYHLDTSLGRGTYRVLLDTTSRDFEDPTGSAPVRRAAVLLSCDQQLGKGVGAFARLARQTEDAEIDYRSLYSGGLDIGGSAWDRPEDNIGVGYAYLVGSGRDLARTRVAEAYYRFVVLPALAITADFQYARDDRQGAPGSEGWIFGIRLTTQF